ncbi:MAG: WD40/YVTN/BNR-like repeat-containing protein, partial [Limisphaerales bacterium]
MAWALASMAPCVAATKPLYYWKNVSIGGGGYITGIVIHPTEPDLVYARTDVGGFYRWDAATSRWIPITDHFTLDQQELYGGESIAIDPKDPNVVYIACGRSLTIGAPSGVFKSTNRGATWERLPLNNVEMHGNGAKRNTGERLVVSPHDSNLLVFGTRGDGLQRSTNGGLTWTKLTSFPDVWTWGTGFTSVEFDPTTPGIVYAAAYGSDADDGV